MAYKIIQWSSGNVGKNSIATVAGRKGLKLVGLYVYNPEKAGMDAGEIAGVGRLGVKATNDKEKLLAISLTMYFTIQSLVFPKVASQFLYFQF